MFLNSTRFVLLSYFTFFTVVLHGLTQLLSFCSFMLLADERLCYFLLVTDKYWYHILLWTLFLISECIVLFAADVYVHF
jgi:hypothetical protein